MDGGTPVGKEKVGEFKKKIKRKEKKYKLGTDLNDDDVHINLNFC